MSSFRLLRAFNDESLRGYAGSKRRANPAVLASFPRTSLFERFVHELALERAVPMKEICEAFEFFALIRKHVRAERVADLCSGHGLAGILYAVAERGTQEVLLLDKRRPQSFEAVWRAALRVAPWVEEKVSYLEGPLERTSTQLQPGCAILGVHACGRLSDRCLEIARTLESPVAIMPCCRDHSLNTGPMAVAQALGGDIAYDIDRTYAMEAANYFVRWREIPAVITPMNRVLIATPRERAGG